MSLLVLGTVAFDTIETPIDKVNRTIGGAGTYISWAASNFYKNIRLVSIVGEDFPQEELDALRNRGVDLEGLERRKGERSFYWAGRYDQDMNSRETLITELNVLADFNPVLPKTYKAVDYLMLGNFAPAVQLQIIEQLPNRPKLVALDTMNFWIESALDDLKKALKKIDILIINSEEARLLSGTYSLVKADRAIREMGPKYLLVKKGEHGALLFHGEETFFVPALPLEEVFDPTGAGDSFAGGFMGYLASTQDFSFEAMKRALVYGSVLASFCVEKFGISRLSELTEDDVKNRVDKFFRLMHIPVLVDDVYTNLSDGE